MLKEILLKKLNTQSQTVNNAIITLGDTDDSGKGRHFKSRFIQPGLAGYPGQYGNALIRKENLDKFIHTMRKKPVIINHKNNITEKDKVGEVFNVWFNPDDGWYWCDGVITDKTAQNLIENKKWSVSCSYDFTKYDDEGGEENGIPYDIEFLDGEFSHLAIVNNPRYERANIVFNSKAEKDNEMEDYKLDNAKDRDGQEGEWITVKGTHVFIPKGKTYEEVIEEKFKSYSDMVPQLKKQLEYVNEKLKDKNSPDKHERLVADKWKLEDQIKYYESQDKKEKSDGGSEEPSDDYKREADIALTMMGQDYEKRGNKETGKRSKELKDKLKKGKELSDKDKSDIKIALDTYKPKDKGSEEKNKEKQEAEKQSLLKNDLKSMLKEISPSADYRYDAEQKELQVRYFGKWEGDDGSGDYDWQTPTAETKEKVQKIKEKFKKRFGYELKADWGEKNWYSFWIPENKKAENSKEQDMAILEILKEFISKVENDKGDNMINNEKEDKRKLIDEVGGILKGKVDDEIIRTIIKKMEEASYNESEAGSADNKKVKNEAEDEDEKVENKKVKNEETKEDKEKVEELKEDEKKDVENKCNNSKETFFDKMNKIYNSSVAQPKDDSYVSRADRLKAGEDYFKI